MKRGGELKRSPLARGTSTLKRSSMKPGSKAMERATKPMARTSKPKGKGGAGLKGRTPTAAEQRFMDMAGQVPCMACKKDGRENRHISLHHVDGRTKPGAHFLVLPLCAPHHQPDKSDPLERVALHDAKKVFAQLYGTERELLAELYALLNFTPPGNIFVRPLL